MSQNSLRLSWTSEEVDERLKNIMLAIHASCVQYGTDENGYVDYVKGANIAGFVKVADAMLAQGGSINKPLYLLNASPFVGIFLFVYENDNNFVL